MPFIFPAAVYQQLPWFYLTSTSSFANPLLLRISFKGDILNLASEHLCLRMHLTVHTEQHGHRKPLSPPVTSQQVSETQCGASQADGGDAFYGSTLKSPSLMKDSLSMTVLEPLVVDLRALRTPADSSSALGILTHF